MSGAKGDIARNQVLVGDVRQVLLTIPDAAIDTVVTSPPYFRLRNYQHGEQIGLEPHVDGWVNELLLVARGLKRVLRPTGSLWLNLGDTFSRSVDAGALPKSLLLAPERLALAMQGDGWILRNKIIWAKPNPMPTSVKDRLSCTWEVVYFFTVSEHYYFDLDAIRVPHQATGRATQGSLAASAEPTTRPPSNHARGKAWSVPEQWRGPLAGSNSGLDRLKASGLSGHPLGKNPGDVWTIPTASYRGAHHAVFPERLIERPLLATCPERVCVTCGQSWIRQPHRMIKQLAVIGELTKGCSCPSTDTRPGIVLDPFMGAGTTAVVAERLGRDWLGIEVNPEFADQARLRIEGERYKRRASAGEAPQSDDISMGKQAA
jgi:site-specific DNA-methyltransferase (adenine-specific)